MRLEPPRFPAFTRFRDSLKDGSLGPEMMVIPAEKFRMGSPKGELGRYGDEGPQHRVRFKNSFALGVTEVTFEEYDRFARATGRKLPKDRGWGRDKRSVIKVTWKDATEYTQWLSGQTGKQYRLPTEAEWEYAARAGTTTSFSTGDCITTSQAIIMETTITPIVGPKLEYTGGKPCLSAPCLPILGVSMKCMEMPMNGRRIAVKHNPSRFF